MTLQEKQELIRLLNLYQADLLSLNDENLENTKDHKRWEVDNLHYGVKAQYDHARIISTKLSVEVGKEIKSYWQL